ncbi:MAG: energy transducer TonB [Pseudomonadota bacterium]
MIPSARFRAICHSDTAKAGWLAATLAASLAFVHSPALAQSTGERVYVDLGHWTILEQPQSRRCVLRHIEPNGVRVVMTKTGTADGSLSFRLATRNVFVGNVIFAFDEDEFPARIDGQSGGEQLYAPDADGAEIEAAFRQSRILTLRQGETNLATVSLQGSSAGFRLLKQCAEQGRLGLTRAAEPTPAPEPAAPRPEQVAEAAPPPPPPPPPSLARPPVPRDPQNWVRENDLRNAEDYQGTVRYTLLVNARGRAEECVVNAISGPRALGELACRTLIRRARFVPALDANGAETAGQWSSSITFRSPT